MATTTKSIHWWSFAVLSYILSLVSLHSVSADSNKCSSVQQCCGCVATPGCSWFYNTPLGDFCKETPRVGTASKTLQQEMETWNHKDVPKTTEIQKVDQWMLGAMRRSPFRIKHIVDVPSGKNKPMDITPIKKKDRIHMAPQEVAIEQGVGMRQEVIFSAMSNSSKLAFRIIDFTNHAVQYTVVATKPSACLGNAKEMKQGDKNFQLKWDGYRRAKNRILIKVDGRNKRIPGDKSFLRVICWRDLSKQSRNDTEFKLIIDTPTCFMGTRFMMIEMPWQRTRKRVVIKVTNDDCKCPCKKKKILNKLVTVEKFDKMCTLRGRRGGKRGSRRRARRIKKSAEPRCDKQAAEVSKSMNCSYENDKCQMAPYKDMCSGNGTCVCGRCVCVPGQYGDHCECNDNSCPYFNGQMCGGEKRGTCDCGTCKCKEEISGRACELDYIPESCKNPLNNNACSGHGACIDGKCHCHHMAAGHLCQIRDSCPLYRHCVECHLLGYDAFSIDRFCARCTTSQNVFYRDMKEMSPYTIINAACHFKDSHACGVNYFYKTYINESHKIVNTTVFIDPKPDCTGVEKPF